MSAMQMSWMGYMPVGNGTMSDEDRIHSAGYYSGNVPGPPASDFYDTLDFVLKTYQSKDFVLAAMQSDNFNLQAIQSKDFTLEL